MGNAFYCRSFGCLNAPTADRGGYCAEHGHFDVLLKQWIPDKQEQQKVLVHRKRVRTECVSKQCNFCDVCRDVTRKRQHTVADDDEGCC